MVVDVAGAFISVVSGMLWRFQSSGFARSAVVVAI